MSKVYKVYILNFVDINLDFKKMEEFEINLKNSLGWGWYSDILLSWKIYSVFLSVFLSMQGCKKSTSFELPFWWYIQQCS